jgi:F420H(2)-dependent quinone reductase
MNAAHGPIVSVFFAPRLRWADDSKLRGRPVPDRVRLWSIMVRQWPGYDGYQRNIDREIPVVVLEPRT